MADKVALHVLHAGVVLDRSVFADLTSDQMAEKLATIRDMPNATLTVVDDSAAFFSATNLLALIRAKDTRFFLVAEKAGMVVSGEDVAAILRADEIEAEIKAKMRPKWTFAPVPEGWTFATHVSYGPTKVRRRAGTDGNSEYHVTPAQMEAIWTLASQRWANSEYHVTPAQMEAIWTLASRRWAKVPGAKYVGARANYSGGGVRYCEVGADRVIIGCQTIQRFELEQIAKHKGWAFPEIAA